MGSIGWYIFRTTFGAFLLILFSLTTVIWLTHALRDIDLMTDQGQTILVFIGITGLIIPQLILIIAPIALMIAIAHSLNKLANDSEIIVMNAAGMSPWRLFRAFLTAALVVSAIVAVIGAYVSPKCIRDLRRWAAEVRADLVTNIVQPGRFTTIERGLTFHIRERQANGLLLGIFVDDLRDPNERATFLAEQGQIVKSDKGTFLVLQDGSVQRHPTAQRDPTIVNFDRYAFDLSHFAGGATEGGGCPAHHAPESQLVADFRRRDCDPRALFRLRKHGVWHQVPAGARHSICGAFCGLRLRTERHLARHHH